MFADQALASLRIETIRYCSTMFPKLDQALASLRIETPKGKDWNDFIVIRLSRACGLKLIAIVLVLCGRGSGSREPAD